MSNGLHQGQMLGVSIEHLKWEDVEKDKNLLLFRHCAQYRYFHHRGAKSLNVIRGEPQAKGQCQGARDERERGQTVRAASQDERTRQTS